MGRTIQNALRSQKQKQRHNLKLLQGTFIFYSHLEAPVDTSGVCCSIDLLIHVRISTFTHNSSRLAQPKAFWDYQWVANNMLTTTTVKQQQRINNYRRHVPAFEVTRKS